MIDALRKQAAERGDRIHVIDPRNCSWSFEDVLLRTQSIARALNDRDINGVEPLALAADPTPEIVPLYYAAVGLGLKLTVLDPDLPPDELKQRLDVVGADHLVGHRSHRELVPDDSNFHELEELPRYDAGGAAPETNSPNEHRLIVFTSGSTGAPKAVGLSWRNMLASARSSSKRLGVREHDWWLSPLGVHHVGGLAPVVRSLVNGTRVTISGYDDNETMDLLRTEPINCVSLVPVMLRRLMDAGPKLPADQLRFILLGGAPTSPELRRRAAQESLPIRPTYGMTETSSQVATAGPEEAVDHPESVGRPLAGVSLRILDAKGNVLPAGQSGEIAVSGPMVTEGYDNRPDLNDRRFGEHGFRTGDRGKLDEEGRLKVTGRMDRRILSGGETVDPGRVEKLLESKPAVSEARVFGVDDPEWNEKICAAVKLKDGFADVPTDVDQMLAKDLRGAERPREVITVDAFPRTASGTIDDDALQGMVGRD